MQIEYLVVSKLSNRTYGVECNNLFTLREALVVAKAWKKENPKQQIEIWKDEIRTKRIKIIK